MWSHGWNTKVKWFPVNSVMGDEGRERYALVVICPFPSLFFFESHLSLSLSLSPTLCEITVTIVTQQIGLEVTAVVGAMATHICLCFALSTCVGRAHTHTHARA